MWIYKSSRARSQIFLDGELPLQLHSSDVTMLGELEINSDRVQVLKMQLFTPPE